MTAPASNGIVPTVGTVIQVGASISGRQPAAALFTGDAPLSYTHQWFRCDSSGANCSPIDRCTGFGYGPIVLADMGGTLRLRYTATNSAGSASVDSAPSAIVKGRNPKLVGSVTLSGTAQVGQTLTGSVSGEWTADEPFTLSYQWTRTGGRTRLAIPGATEPSYTAVLADEGFTLYLTVTATTPTGASGGAVVYSALIAPPPPAPVSLAAPTLSGTLRVGETLQANGGDWQGDGLTLAYQWERSSDAGATWTVISGAIGSSYQLAAADAEASVRVRVTASNGGGSVDAASDAAGPVASKRDESTTDEPDSPVPTPEVVKPPAPAPLPPRHPQLRFATDRSTLTLSWEKADASARIIGYELRTRGELLRELPAATTDLALPSRILNPRRPLTLEIVAVNAAGNRSEAATLTATYRDRPAAPPRLIPHWAWQLLTWRSTPLGGRGVRPAGAPQRVPDWFWPWANWRLNPYTIAGSGQP